MDMADREKARNYLAFGECGDWVLNDDNKRKVVRTDNFVNTLPTCLLYENGVFVRREPLFSKSIEFLFT